MRPLTSDVRVILAPDGFYPQTIQWQGGTLRVLCVEGFRTTGMQRRFRVRTPRAPLRSICMSTQASGRSTDAPAGWRAPERIWLHSRATRCLRSGAALGRR